MTKTFAAAAAGAALMMTSGPALANAKLLEASPAADAAVATPAQIVLHFSERLEPKFSGFEIVSGQTPAAVTTTVGKDQKSLVGAPAKPLGPGAYQLTWHVVSADGHRMTGAYSFTVR